MQFFFGSTINRTTSNKSNWFFKSDSSCLKGAINEKIILNTGIHKKISRLEKLGNLTIIGKCIPDSSDELFYLERDDAIKNLREIISSTETGFILFFYVPHPFFAHHFNRNYKWLPTWRELYDQLKTSGEVDILEYSTSFDPAGRYFLTARKVSIGSQIVPEFLISQQVFRVFYHPDGADLHQGHSSRALSAHLCHLLFSKGATVYSYGFQDISGLDEAKEGDILIGHVGPWVKEAYDRGFRRIILYNPSNRWYPTRNSETFESNATIEEQVKIARMVIAQSGTSWRLTAENPDLWKWRWIDIGVDRSLFPRKKDSFSPPGKRKFCAINLYNAKEKGSDIVISLVKSRPSYQFTWIAGEKVNQPNVKYYNFIPNTSKKFQKIVTDCDFLLVPSREDAQPGTVCEAIALGLIPVVSYMSGYSIGYPSVVFSDNVEEWLKIVDTLQNISEKELHQFRLLLDRYLDYCHNWPIIEEQICFYLQEYLTCYDVTRPKLQ